MANRLREEVENAAIQAVASRLGDLVTALWDHSLGLLVNLILLPRNGTGLAQEMQKLQALWEDLRQRAKSERDESALQGNQAELSNQLSVWMDRVTALVSDVSVFQRSFEDLSLCIPRIICLGYNAAGLLRLARNLFEEGSTLPHTGLVRQLGPVAIVAVPSGIPSSSLVGDKATLRRIQGHALDDAVGVVGIWGMGGVGKTTLLQIINNEFLIQGEARGKFELTIWVTVSKDGGISSVREALCKRLGLQAHSEREVLFGKLFSHRRFILLLDDVWERLDFDEIGIPHPRNVNNSCKILFTTRSEHVCSEMDADKMVNVGLLDAQVSWELFQSKLGRAAVTLDNSDIQPLAKEVVSRCGGLPISLVTVGRALAGAKSPSDWQDAINKLDHCAEEVKGMSQVLTSLKYSYDMLNSDTLRSCLLYCALFPEDHSIGKTTIVEHWVGEGLLDPRNCDEYDIDETRNRGHALITELKCACLLEEGDEDVLGLTLGTVKLHDTVRDMALWIVRKEFVVLAGSVGTRVPHSHIWQNTKRISLAWNDMKREPPYFSVQLHCPNLTTLLLRDSKLFRKCVPNGFFTYMPALLVLDLCGASIEEFPIEITSLMQLQHLNLGGTQISHLPVELGKLTKLRQLLLGDTRSLRWIPQEAVSPLSRLQVLDMYESRYVFGRVGAATDGPPSATTTSPTCDNGGGDVVLAAEEAHVLPQLGLSDLEENLKRIGDVSLNVDSWSALHALAASPVLRMCVRKLWVQFADDDSPPSAAIISQTIGQLQKLRELELVDNAVNPVEGDLLSGFRPDQLQNLEDLNMYNFNKARTFVGIHDRTIMWRLRRLAIVNCHGVSELTWVGHLPSLEVLLVSNCHGVTELLLQQLHQLDAHDDRDFTPPPFLRLKDMILRDLPSLRSISMHPLLLPSLEILEVIRCPELKRLPLGLDSAKNIRELEGEQAWWDALEWGDDNYGADQGSTSVKSKFRDHFRACC